MAATRAWQVDLRAAACPGATLTPLGGWQCGYLLQGGLEVVVVSQQAELEPALRRLCLLLRTCQLGLPPTLQLQAFLR